MRSGTIEKDSAAVGAGARAMQFPGWLRAGFWVCTVIAVLAVLRRFGALVRPPQSGPPVLVQLDQYFAAHRALTLAHIVPALFFVLLTPWVLARARVSARLQRLWFALGVMVGTTAYAMSVEAVGGWVERSAVLLFDTLFLACLARAFSEWRRGDRRAQLRWMVLAVGVLLGIATTRPVMGAFFATSRLTGWTPQEFFGYAFWIGFGLNTAAVAAWVARRQ
jgi:hypothetical protein